MSKPSPVLSDMPWAIKRKIVQHTNFVTRLVLRKTSTEFREFVDCSPYPTHYKSIEMSVYKKRVLLEFVDNQGENFKVEYRKADFKNRIEWDPDWKILCGKFDHIERAVIDLAVIFANRRATVSKFILPVTDYVEHSVKRSLKTFAKDKSCFLDTFEEKFSKLPYPALFGKVTIDWTLTESEMMKIIPFLEPRFLRELTLEPTADSTLKNFLKTEQFLNLRSITLGGGKPLIGSFLASRICKYTEIHNAIATTAQLMSLLTKLLHNKESFGNFSLRHLNYNRIAFLDHLIHYHQLPPQDTDHHIIKMVHRDDYLAVLFKENNVFFVKMDQERGLAILEGRLQIVDDTDD